MVQQNSERRIGQNLLALQQFINHLQKQLWHLVINWIVSKTMNQTHAQHVRKLKYGTSNGMQKHKLSIMDHKKIKNKSSKFHISRVQQAKNSLRKMVKCDKQMRFILSSTWEFSYVSQVSVECISAQAVGTLYCFFHWNGMALVCYQYQPYIPRWKHQKE